MLSDQRLLIYILGQAIKRLCGCPLIFESQVENQEAYPFFTYTFISSEKDKTFDWLEKNTPYETVISITAHTNNPLDANDLVMKLREGLNLSRYRSFFLQADIIPQSQTNSSNRTAMQVPGFYDYRFGFDATFLILRGNAKDISKLNFDGEDLTIESVSTKEEE